MPTAVLVDGGFFLKRYQSLRGKRSPKHVATDTHKMCLTHLRQKHGPRRSLYRIFYYDYPPLTKKAHHPLTGQSIDFSRTPTGVWRCQFLQELKRHRKGAVRLGYLNESDAQWTIHRSKLKSLLSGKLRVSDLSEHDVRYHAPQKGVDMRIGIDVASMCFKKQVDQIVLVAGDSDFVPAAKLARREGVDFTLDPMWAHIRDDLHEHIDGLRSVLPRQMDPSASSAADND